MSERIYTESFDDGPGGWIGWNADGASALEIVDSAAVSRSPWWVDINHAPPGEGYLHLLYCLHTHPRWSVGEVAELGGENRFTAGEFPTDFTNAKVTVRMRGQMQKRGAEIVLLAQAKVGDMMLNHVLTAQPIEVTQDWSEQSLIPEPDDEQWRCLGSRHDRRDFYGWGPVEDVLKDLNGDIIFVMHPLDVAPTTHIDGDIHRLKADADYPVDRTRLPEGEVMLDRVSIEFA